MQRGRARAVLAGLGALAIGFAVGLGVQEWRGHDRAASASVATTSAGPSSSTSSSTTGTSTTTSRTSDASGRLALPDILPTGSLRVPILMYHRVADPTKDHTALERSLTVSPRVFASQLDWLRAHGFHTITQLQLYRALIDGATLPAHPVMLTFDDGYVDISTTVLPVIRRRKMVATAYVITSRVTGNDRAFMKMRDLRRIEAGGIEVGSHSVNHLQIPDLSTAAAMHELRDSRRTLERGLGHPVQWFCYPAGHFDARSVQLAREAGYLLATTTEYGAVHDRSAPLALHRVRIANTTGVAGLRAALG